MTDETEVVTRCAGCGELPRLSNGHIVHMRSCPTLSESEPVSVPLPIPTPGPQDREALRDAIALKLAHVDSRGDARIAWTDYADEVMPLVEGRISALEAKVLRRKEDIAELRQHAGWREAKILELRKEAIRNGNRATDEFNRAESSFQELAIAVAERAQIVAALDGYQLVDGDCGQPSGTLVQHVAALRDELATTRRELAKAKAAIRDIDAHATPMGLLNADDPDGSPHHYAVTVGALHRALGVGGTAPKCSQQYERAERLEKELAKWQGIHETTQRALIAMEKQRDAWKAALGVDHRDIDTTPEEALAALTRREPAKVAGGVPKIVLSGECQHATHTPEACPIVAGSSPVPEEPPKDWRPGEDEMVTGKSRRDGEPDPVGKYAGQVGKVARIRVPGAWIDALRGNGRYIDPSMYRYVDLDTLRPAAPSVLPEERQ